MSVSGAGDTLDRPAEARYKGGFGSTVERVQRDRGTGAGWPSGGFATIMGTRLEHHAMEHAYYSRYPNVRRA